MGWSSGRAGRTFSRISRARWHRGSASRYRPRFPYRTARLFSVAATCGTRRQVRRRKAQPGPPSLRPYSPRGARGPASAPGSAGRPGGGPWPPCTCSGPCGAASGWRVSQAEVAGARLKWHPLGVPSRSPHTKSSSSRALPSLWPPQEPPPLSPTLTPLPGSAGLPGLCPRPHCRAPRRPGPPCSPAQPALTGTPAPGC